MKNLLVFWCLALAFTSVEAQSKAEVLMTIDGTPVYASEFIQVYEKNLDLVEDDSQKNIDSYLQLFKEYRLKLLEAKKMGLLERTDLKKELQGYQNQLAENYMMDSPITEALVQEAYDHMVNEVEASHIMVQLKDGATPEDTLKAYKTIQEIRERLLNGADFEKVARAESEDPSVARNNGDLGWFNAFKMVYPFEKAAYTTPVDSISDVVRSSYGYHVLKTTNKRKSRGEVEVAHIMLALNNRAVNDQERRISEIYQKLQQGESFDILARKYSEDSKSAKRGGDLDRFASGGLNSPIFEEQAFALKNPGDISEPFKSEVGWHIVRLKNKFPIDSLNALRPLIESRIKSDSRSMLLEEGLAKKLEAELKPVENFEFLIDDQKLAQKQNLPLLFIRKDTLFTNDFLEFVGNANVKNDLGTMETSPLKTSFARFKSLALRNYYKAHLAENNPEYAQISREYEEGILLFALMEEKIWNAAKDDSIGLENYFSAHRESYEAPARYNVLVMTAKDQKIAKKGRKMLKKGDSIPVIKKDLNTESAVNVFFTNATVGTEDPLLPQGYEVQEGVSKIYESPEEFTVVQLKNNIVPAPLTLEEVRGRVISDYQEFLEEEWLKQLQREHTIKVNTQVLEKVKNELSR